MSPKWNLQVAEVQQQMRRTLQINLGTAEDARELPPSLEQGTQDLWILNLKQRYCEKTHGCLRSIVHNLPVKKEEGRTSGIKGTDGKAEVTLYKKLCAYNRTASMQNGFIFSGDLLCLLGCCGNLEDVCNLMRTC